MFQCNIQEEFQVSKRLSSSINSEKMTRIICFIQNSFVVNFAVFRSFSVEGPVILSVTSTKNTEIDLSRAPPVSNL